MESYTSIGCHTNIWNMWNMNRNYKHPQHCASAAPRATFGICLRQLLPEIITRFRNLVISRFCWHLRIDKFDVQIISRCYFSKIFWCATFVHPPAVHAANARVLWHNPHVYTSTICHDSVSPFFWANIDYDTLHWKSYIPEIHQMEKLRFLGILRYKFKLRFQVEFVPRSLSFSRRRISGV